MRPPTGVYSFYSGVAWIFFHGAHGAQPTALYLLEWILATLELRGLFHADWNSKNGCAVRRDSMLRVGVYVVCGWGCGVGDSLGGASERLFSDVCVGA